MYSSDVALLADLEKLRLTPAQVAGLAVIIDALTRPPVGHAAAGGEAGLVARQAWSLRVAVRALEASAGAQAPAPDGRELAVRVLTEARAVARRWISEAGEHATSTERNLAQLAHDAAGGLYTLRALALAELAVCTSAADRLALYEATSSARGAPAAPSRGES